MQFSVINGILFVISGILVVVSGIIGIILRYVPARMCQQKSKRYNQKSTKGTAFPYEKYRIEWNDIYSDSGWATKNEFKKMKLTTPVSEGWLFEKNNETIKIFASYDKRDDEIVDFGDRTVIPTSCVKKMTRI